MFPFEPCSSIYKVTISFIDSSFQKEFWGGSTGEGRGVGGYPRGCLG